MGCDFELDTKLVDDYISIHAPIVGCDAPTFIKTGFELLFQSTHPSWGATLLLVLSTQMILISIHAPIVGCDCFLFRFFLSSINISIHAPIVGCDICNREKSDKLFNFNPRTHRGVRRGTEKAVKVFQNFNPRTHRGVRQRQDARLDAHSKISIHAPIVGCDLPPSVFNGSNSYFNPRTHRGVRLGSKSPIRRIDFDFNPRTHRGVRHEALDIVLSWLLISIHAPIVGCDALA